MQFPYPPIAAKADELSITNTRAGDFGILKWAIPLIWSNSGHSQNGGTEISANNDWEVTSYSSAAGFCNKGSGTR